MMIITSDSDLKDATQVDIIVNRATAPDDPPPPYVDIESRAATTSAPTLTLASLAPPVPGDVTPTNFLSLSRGFSSIKDTYVIDPRVRILQSMLPLLAADETEARRRNVFLHTTNGAIDVDLFVLGEVEQDVKNRKVEMLVKTSNGSLPQNSWHGGPAARAPIHLTAHSSNGPITLHLPRSVRGPISVRSCNGSIRFSGPLGVDTTTFSEANQTRRCYNDIWSILGTPEITQLELTFS
ncbi:hypothetical protein B0H11DRAFT_2254011 [Mycena galericulata]|nr:hypothetical protein B0H11DRAFT_2254011 [Mycena galericulata]